MQADCPGLCYGYHGVRWALGVGRRPGRRGFDCSRKLYTRVSRRLGSISGLVLICSAPGVVEFLGLLQHAVKGDNYLAPEKYSDRQR